MAVLTLVIRTEKVKPVCLLGRYVLNALNCFSRTIMTLLAMGSILYLQEINWLKAIKSKSQMLNAQKN